jgi:hypothetical protein
MNKRSKHGIIHIVPLYEPVQELAGHVHKRGVEVLSILASSGMFAKYFGLVDLSSLEMHSAERGTLRAVGAAGRGYG